MNEKIYKYPFKKFTTRINDFYAVSNFHGNVIYFLLKCCIRYSCYFHTTSEKQKMQFKIEILHNATFKIRNTLTIIMYYIQSWILCIKFFYMSKLYKIN